jgi:hypothetical protein
MINSRKNNIAVIQHIIHRAKLALPTTIIGVPGLAKKDLVRNLTSVIAEDPEIAMISINVHGIPETHPYNIFYSIRKALLPLIKDAPPLGAYAFDDNILKVIDEIQGLLVEVAKQEKNLLIVFYNLSDYTGDIDVYSNIDALKNFKSGNISFAFVDNPQLFRIKNGPKKYGTLYNQIMSTVMWLKMPTRKIFDDELAYWSKEYNYKFPQELQNFIWKQTAGHPALVKHMLAYFFENSSLNYELSVITEHFILNTNLEQIIDALDKEEVETLRQIAQSGEFSNAKNNSTTDALLNYDLIERVKNGYKIKIGLLEDFLLRENNKFATVQSRLKLPQIEEEMTFDLKLQQGDVFIDGVKIDSTFTEREYHVIEYMASQRGKICTREQLADVIWKGNVEEKYSAWGLDQTVSRIRKKLGDNGYQPKFIKTLRGRGFKLEL